MTAPDPNGSPSTEDGGDDDAVAQQALADAAREAGDGADAEDDSDDDQWDETAARRKWEKAQREARNLREELKKLRPLAEEAEKRRQGEMTESQKLAEQKAQLEIELAELRTSNVRREAAEAAGLPARFTKFITAAEPDEALKQAKELAKELRPSDEREQGPRADLRQGARGQSNAGRTQTPDELLRAMARQR